MKDDKLGLKKTGRYNVSGLVEAQFERGSRGRVLRNLLGIKRKRQMDDTEVEALQRAVDTLLHCYDKNHSFNVSDVREMHRVWLGEIYEWAGNYRNVNLSKGEFTFAAARQVPMLMEKFEQGVLTKHTPCNFKSRERVVTALAEVHTELILIHPFREGNGRVARILATLMANQVGLSLLDFEPLEGRKRPEYLVAVAAGLDHNYEPMEEIFRRIIERTLRCQP